MLRVSVRRRGVVGVLACCLLLLVGVVVPGTVASSATVAQRLLVDANPANFTPDVLDGQVLAIAEVGNRIILGGDFTQVQEAAGGPVQTRNYILAFDKRTGALDTGFVPQVNAPVRALAPAADGQSIYIAGSFGQVNGLGTSKVARVDVVTGAKITTFKAKNINSQVEDLKFVAGRLFIGGHFTTVDSQPRTALAELDPATGALLPSVNLSFAGVHWGGDTHVYKMDVTADGARMVVLGNFLTINGQDRVEAAMLDLAQGPAVLANWQTDRFKPRCYNRFDFVVRDVDFAPDGSYFVLATTGGYGPGTTSLCDTTSRWETADAGTARQPTWVDYTGGDSTFAVAVTGTAVYAGGHQRWENNPFRADAAGPGAVSREGIAALDPANGLPLSWNPGRTLGLGVRDLLATPDGLWMGSDTDRVANELHGRIAFFPIDPGGVVPQPAAPDLPAEVYSLNPRSGTGSSVTRRSFDGAVAGSAGLLAPSGVTWDAARGTALMNGQLYTAWSDGHLDRRSFNGATFGAPSTVNLLGLAAFVTEMQSMTSMFYENGRLYFTRANQSNLYMRYFTTENDMIGAQSFTVAGNVPGVDWSKVQNSFLAGGRLYWADRDTGNLQRVDWAGGGPVAATGATVSGPSLDGVDWRAQSLFARTAQPNKPPSASITRSCSNLSCSFDGSGSRDADGAVVSYAWDFGDGTGSAETVTDHAFPSPGTYTVSLVVTDDLGAVDQAAVPVSVSSASSPIVFVDAAHDAETGSVRTHRVVVPAAVQPGDALILAFSDNAPAQSITDPPGWTRFEAATSAGMATVLWQRVASESDAGSTVAVGTSGFARADLMLLVYRGTSAVDPTATAALAPETATTTAHVTPVVDVPNPGSWVVSYWADKSASTTAWAVPDGQIVRSVDVAQTGSGHITAVASDAGSASPIGPAGGTVSTASSASKNATAATIVLTPAA